MLYTRTFGHEDGNAQGQNSVLMLHPANYDGRIWRDVAAYLPNMTVLAVDLPGHGKTRNIPLTNLDNAADLIADMIQKLEHPPKTIVGLSLGAYVGFSLLSRHPHLMDTAILSGFQHEPIRMNAVMRWLLEASASLTAIRPIRERMAKAMGVTDLALCHDPNGKANSTVRTARKALSLAIDFDARKDFDKVSARTLVISGEREHETIINSLRIFEARLPNCQARVARGLGHGWSIEAPDLFAKTVSAWISRAALPDGLVSPNIILKK